MIEKAHLVDVSSSIIMLQIGTVRNKIVYPCLLLKLSTLSWVAVALNFCGCVTCLMTMGSTHSPFLCIVIIKVLQTYQKIMFNILEPNMLTLDTTLLENQLRRNLQLQNTYHLKNNQLTYLPNRWTSTPSCICERCWGFVNNDEHKSQMIFLLSKLIPSQQSRMCLFVENVNLLQIALVVSKLNLEKKNIHNGLGC